MYVTAPGLEGLETELIYDEEKDVCWQEIPNTQKFIHLGFCKAPSGIWQTFWHHFFHGMLMGYSLRDVVIFSLKNWGSFGWEVRVELAEE